jgi:hypothetical protein
MRILFSLILAAAIPAYSQEISKQEKKEGFKPLFKSLKDWKGDPDLWKAEKGVITGNTDNKKIAHNTFLIHTRQFGDFHVKFQVKLRNHNSGVQFRSEEMPDYVVAGLQADMAKDNYWGCIYDEKGKRGVICDGWKGKAETVVKKDDWNDYEIYAKGDLIRITVNGLVTCEIHDSARMSGVLALQLHAGPGMQVEFRKMRIKTL